MSSGTSRSQGRSRRLVLRLFKAEADVQALADGLGWPMVAERPSGGGQPRRVVWEIVPGINVSYLEDDGIQASYVVVTSNVNPDEIENFFRMVSSNLDSYSVEELAAMPASVTTVDARARSVVLAGLGAPKTVDQGILSTVTGAAQDTEDRVREAAVVAASFAEWPELRPVLQEISVNDRKRSIRKLAKKLLDVYDTLGIGEP